MVPATKVIVQSSPQIPLYTKSQPQNDYAVHTKFIPSSVKLMEGD